MKFRIPGKPKLSKRDEKLWDALHFLIRLLLFSIPLYLILWMNPSLLPLQEAVTAQSRSALGLLGVEVLRSDLVLMVGESCDPFIMFIGPDCTGWKSMVLFFALLFATVGASMRKRIAGLLIGLPVIHFGNVARIVVVVLIQRALGTDAAVLCHDVLWQAGLGALVLGLWAIWLKWDAISTYAAPLAGRLNNIIGKKKE